MSSTAIPTLQKLRHAEFGPVSGHQANWINRSYTDWCDYLVGAISASEYAALRATLPPSFYRPADPHGLNTGLDIDWTAGKYTAASQHVLAARFWATQDVRYANRYIDLIHDFATDGRAQFEALSLAERRSAGIDMSTGNAGHLLDAADFLKNVVTSFAIIAKALDNPAPSSTTVYSYGGFPTSTLADTAPLSPAQAGRVDADKIVETVRSLAEMFFDDLLTHYSLPVRIPNQRMEGLAAIARFVEIFEDIPEIAAFRPRLDAGLENLFGGIFHPDGGMLEHSLNYNNGTAAKAQQLVDMMPDAPWAGDVARSVAYYDLLKQGLATPFGTVPQIGHSVFREGPGSAVPLGQESFAAPFSGYYVQRGGYERTDDYLFFYEKEANRGHVTAGGNSIQLAAEGKLLLISGGIANYSNDAVQFPLSNEYRTWGSSWKTNTILVDGKSQVQVVSNTLPAGPVQSRWLDSEVFDYVEGTFAEGYRDHVAGGATITDTTHTRKVIYYEEKGIWIVVDTMNSPTQRDYTQVWKFAQSFAKGDVTTDAGAKRVVADGGSSADSVNLEIRQFGTAITYEKHHGSDGGRFGYVGSGFSGEPQFGVDVHAKFTGRGAAGAAGDVTVITILNPFKGSTPDSTDIRYADATRGGVAGVDLSFADGQTLFVRAAPDPAQLSAGGRTAAGKDLLVFADRVGAPDALLVTGDRTERGASWQEVGGAYDFLLVPDQFVWDRNEAGQPVVDLHAGAVPVLGEGAARPGLAPRVGQAGPDQMKGGASNDALIGLEGNDTLEGGAGDDVLAGGPGADALYGGKGTDRADYAGSSQGVSVHLGTGRGRGGDAAGDVLVSIADISGSRHDDNLTGNRWANVLSGDLGDDILRGDRGNDRLFGGSGNDHLFGQSGNDRLVGGDGNDVLDGGSGDDRLDGNLGNDLLYGGRGGDLLFGGEGDDTIWGGADTDTLSGGSGPDVFVFRAASESPAGRGRDTITDFQPGQDKLHLAAIDARPSTGRDDAFVFIGSAAFSGTAGQLRQTGALVEGDLNGDRVADFQIVLTGAPTLTAGDFIL